MSEEVEDEDFCKSCGLTISDVDEMYYGIPIDQSFQVRVNICGNCINREEYERMTQAQEAGEGDEFYHFEIHEEGEDE